MSWRFYEEKQPGERIQKVEHEGNWWTNAISKLEVQLTADAVQKLAETFNMAAREGKPLTFFLVENMRAKWRRIETKRGAEFYISEYAEDIWTEYDPDKIGSLATNSISTYYSWSSLPPDLKGFISGSGARELRGPRTGSLRG